jgi:hypothetical protein
VLKQRNKKSAMQTEGELKAMIHLALDPGREERHWWKNE